MGSSGGGGGFKPPAAQTPPGAVGLGQTSAPQGWAPSSMVLPNSGAPMTPEMMAEQWQNPNFFAAAPTPVVNNAGPPVDLKAELSKLMAQQAYPRALQRVSNERIMSGDNNAGINSFGTLRSILNPNLTGQQRLALVKRTALNKSSRGGR